jgi:hypothetical protein
MRDANGQAIAYIYSSIASLKQTLATASAHPGVRLSRRLMGLPWLAAPRPRLNDGRINASDQSTHRVSPARNAGLGQLNDMIKCELPPAITSIYGPLWHAAAIRGPSCGSGERPRQSGRPRNFDGRLRIALLAAACRPRAAGAERPAA